MFQRLRGTVALAPVGYGLAPLFATWTSGLQMTTRLALLRSRVEDAKKSRDDMDRLDLLFRHLDEPPILWLHRIVALRVHIHRRYTHASLELDTYLRHLADGLTNE